MVVNYLVALETCVVRYPSGWYRKLVNHGNVLVDTIRERRCIKRSSKPRGRLE
jgi:hypothetical protein